MGQTVLLAVVLFLVGCNDATETNVMPAPCETDEDCPRGVRCGVPAGEPPDAGLYCLLDER